MQSLAAQNQTMNIRGGCTHMLHRLLGRLAGVITDAVDAARRAPPIESHSHMKMMPSYYSRDDGGGEGDTATGDLSSKRRERRGVDVKCPSEGEAGNRPASQPGSYARQPASVRKRSSFGISPPSASLSPSPVSISSLPLFPPFPFFHATPKLNSLSHDTRTCISWS